MSPYSAYSNYLDGTGLYGKVPWRFPKCPNVRDLQGTSNCTHRDLIQKFMVYDLLRKLYFKSNSLCITYLFQSFTRNTNIEMFQMETPVRCLLILVAGCLRDQIMGYSRYDHYIFFFNFLIQLTNTLNLLWQVTQHLLVNGCGKKFSEQFMVPKIIWTRKGMVSSARY